MTKGAGKEGAGLPTAEQRWPPKYVGGAFPENAKWTKRTLRRADKRGTKHIGGGSIVSEKLGISWRGKPDGAKIAGKKHARSRLESPWETHEVKSLEKEEDKGLTRARKGGLLFASSLPADLRNKKVAEE